MVMNRSRIKRKIFIATISVFISYAIFSFRIYKSMLNLDFRQNTTMHVGNGYLYRPDTRLENVFLELPEAEHKTLGFHSCSYVTKLSYAQVKSYIAGYIDKNNSLEDKVQKVCNGYFYINLSDKNDFRLGLTEKDMKEKFGEIQYYQSVKFLNEYGYGSVDRYNISVIIDFNLLFCAFWSFIIYGMISIIFSKNRFGFC